VPIGRPAVKGDLALNQLILLLVLLVLVFLLLLLYRFVSFRLAAARAATLTLLCVCLSHFKMECRLRGAPLWLSYLVCRLDEQRIFLQAPSSLRQLVLEDSHSLLESVDFTCVMMASPTGISSTAIAAHLLWLQTFSSPTLSPSLSHFHSLSFFLLSFPFFFCSLP